MGTRVISRAQKLKRNRKMNLNLNELGQASSEMGTFLRFRVS